jgi:ribonuclease-3 family protein
MIAHSESIAADPLWGGTDTDKNAADLPSLTLAYIGDVVFELMVRRHYLDEGVLKTGLLHNLTIEQVCASRQSLLAETLYPNLNEDEIRVYKRGRNAKGGRYPSSAAVLDYRRATGIEALIGYLYLRGDRNRLAWILNAVFGEK